MEDSLLISLGTDGVSYSCSFIHILHHVHDGGFLKDFSFVLSLIGVFLHDDKYVVVQAFNSEELGDCIWE